MLRREEIGGGYVERMFKRGEEMLKRGVHLTGDELRAMSPVNLRALVEGRFLNVYPASPKAPPAAEDVSNEATATDPETGLVVMRINKGFGKFDVIEGRVLNDAPMTKEQADAFIVARQATAH